MMSHKPVWLSQCDIVGRQFELSTSDVTVESDPFELRFCRDPTRLERLVEEMGDAFARHIVVDHVDEPSRWCAVHDDTGWWRGEVLSCNRDDLGFVTSVTVLYIDRGHIEVVPITRIFRLDPRFLEVPPLSISAVVDGLRVTNVAKLRSLFKTHPKAKVRIRVTSASAGFERLHVAPLRSQITLGYQDWIEFAELCCRLEIGEYDDDSISESPKSRSSGLRKDCPANNSGTTKSDSESRSRAAHCSLPTADEGQSTRGQDMVIVDDNCGKELKHEVAAELPAAVSSSAATGSANPATVSQLIRPARLSAITAQCASVAANVAQPNCVDQPASYAPPQLNMRSIDRGRTTAVAASNLNITGNVGAPKSACIRGRGRIPLALCRSSSMVPVIPSAENNREMPKANMVPACGLDSQDVVCPSSRELVTGSSRSPRDTDPFASYPSAGCIFPSMQPKPETGASGVTQAIEVNSPRSLSNEQHAAPIRASFAWSVDNSFITACDASEYSNGNADAQLERPLSADGSSKHSFETAESSCTSSDDEVGYSELGDCINKQERRSGHVALGDNRSINSTEEDPDDGYAQYKRHTETRMRRTMQQAEIAKMRNERFTRTCLAFSRSGECPLGEICPFLHRVIGRQRIVVQGLSDTMREVPEFNLAVLETMFVIVFTVDDTFTLFAVPVYGRRSIWDVMEFPDSTELNVTTIRDRLEKKYNPVLKKKNVAGRVELKQGVMVSVWLGLEGKLSGWHRGKLLRADFIRGSVDIFLVDHGREIRALASHAFPLENEFFEYPRQAIRCSLADVQPAPGATAEMLFQRLQDQLLILRVNERSTSTDIKVDLFTVGETHSVAERLVNEGLFRLEQCL